MKVFLSNFKFCMGLLYRANKVNFVILLLGNSLSLLEPFINLYLSKYLIDTVVSVLGGHSGASSALQTLQIIITIYLISSVCIGFCSDFMRKMTDVHMQNLLTYINVELMKKSVEIDIAYFDIPQKYDDITRSMENAHSLHQIIFSTLTTFSNIASLIIAVIIAVNTSIVLSLLVLICLIPSFLFKAKIEKLNYGFSKEQYRDIRRNTYLYQMLFNRNTAKELRFFSVGNHFLNNFLVKTEELVGARIQFTKKRKLMSILLDIPSYVLQIIINIYVVLRILTGQNTLGDYGFITGIYNNFYSGILGIASNISTFIGYNQKINDFKAYFMLNTSDIKSGEQIITGIDSITFENVSFTYPQTTKPVLDNVSFTITKNEKVMLAGLNGAGKSTIVKLLTRFYEPCAGRILINGTDISCFDTGAMRSLFATVFQDYNIYSFKIRENVAFSDFTMMGADSKIKDALSFSGFDNAGYMDNRDIDLYIGKVFSEDGLELSGGQRQKLAIARAVFRDADVIVLDEPTSALDPEAEYKLLKIFKTLYSSKMLLMVSHRLSNAAHMDKIILLEDGRIVELGSHDELYRNNGRYKSLFHLQADKYCV